jgi:hypothetical protein
MKRLITAFAVLLTLTLFNAGLVSAQALVTGAAGGAFYKFAVPQEWGGDLVIWNDGLNLSPITPFDVDPREPLAGLGPLAAVQLQEGFAVATTSRRQIGWAVFKSNNDLRSMMDSFVSQFGTPKRIFVTGGSLGGLVAIEAIETAHLGKVVGGLSLCGALAGSRNWDLALDLRLTYDAVCSAVPGAAIPGGAEGLPAGSTISATDVAGAVNLCTGNLLPAALRSPEQQARLDKILGVTKIPENFLQTDMIFATLGMSDLVHDRTKLNGKIVRTTWR